MKKQEKYLFAMYFLLFLKHIEKTATSDANF